MTKNIEKYIELAKGAETLANKNDDVGYETYIDRLDMLWKDMSWAERSYIETFYLRKKNNGV